VPRCADESCRRWRPDLRPIEGLATKSARRIGALQFNGQWYCSRICVERAARAGLGAGEPTVMRAPALPPLKLGVLLRHAGVITQAELESALVSRGRSGLKIGEQLEQLGFATADEVLRALAIQAGVSYLSTFEIARVQRGSVPIPEAMVRALGLVPFEADQLLRKLSVVCAAPVPRAALRALIALTGWAPEVYLVTDRVFQAALEAYRSAPGGLTLHHPVTVENLGAAAAHVADVAADERAVTMRHAECNDYRWVRIEGPQRVSDLLVTIPRKETGCQAELTAH